MALQNNPLVLPVERSGYQHRKLRTRGRKWQGLSWELSMMSEEEAFNLGSVSYRWNTWR